jgi:amino acid transporter
VHSNTSNNYHQKIKHQEKSKTTKLSFLTVMIFSVGSCIGAGIFFKNQSILDNTGHNVVLMYLSWAIAIVGVMMIGLTLKELTSKAQKYGSEGYLG